MEFKLETNDPLQILYFKEVVRFADDSGYSTSLTVRSGKFAVNDWSFYFDRDSLAAFIETVKQMDKLQPSQGSLTYRHEKDRISLELGSLGQVIVSGELVELGAHRQEFRFVFCTDQTCLKPLLTKLDECWNMAPEPEP